MAREDEIKLIAYSIWEEEGCPPGRDCDHWYRAEVIWEARQPKAAARSTKIESKPAAKSTSKASTAQKKSKPA